MTEATNQPPVGVPDRVPAAAWTIAWSCLVGQALVIADRGVANNPEILTLASAVASAAVVAWFSSGVLKGRTGRLVFVWFVFVVSAIADLAATTDPGPRDVQAWDVVHAAFSMAQLAALAWFSGTRYFKWQRTRPQVPGPSLRPLIAIAALSGALGGAAATSDADQIGLHVGVYWGMTERP